MRMRMRCDINGEQSERGHGGTGVEKKDDRGSSAGNLVARLTRVGARRACCIAVTPQGAVDIPKGNHAKEDERQRTANTRLWPLQPSILTIDGHGSSENVS
jgi:hypothetical protein